MTGVEKSPAPLWQEGESSQTQGTERKKDRAKKKISLYRIYCLYNTDRSFLVDKTGYKDVFEGKDMLECIYPEKMRKHIFQSEITNYQEFVYIYRNIRRRCNNTKQTWLLFFCVCSHYH